MVLALVREMLQQPLVLLLLMLATKASAMMTTRAMRILFLILGEIGARKPRKRKRMFEGTSRQVLYLSPCIHINRMCRVFALIHLSMLWLQDLI
ncbi:unnamed protein product [Merluccius merluccius]